MSHLPDTLSRLRAGELAGATRLDLSCGLTSFPEEIFELARTLEILNLTGNRLSDLPADLTRLAKLKILFCSSNEFEHVPEVLGSCPSLEMVGFKSNRIAKVEEDSLPSSLRWLILTDNRIERLPGSIGRCTGLRKLMLAGNRLEELPAEMAFCTALELIRLSANCFHSLPSWLFQLPLLSWLAISGNPLAAAPVSLETEVLSWNDIELQERLGEGASGVIYQALRRSAGEELPAAVKVFKGEVTSDGFPADEMAASLAAGDHPHLIPVLGRIADHPEGRHALVMKWIGPEYRSLAAPPDFQTCTRDVYAPDLLLTASSVRGIAASIAAAAAALHGRGLIHGDLYAHNILWNGHSHALLGDFGAASFHPPGLAPDLERIEVRAFGCLLEELLARADRSADADLGGLQELAGRCLSPRPSERPLFREIVIS
ncbi:leucine-rich repeat-containing serine/threonine-protein kinase [Luteolibacter sp. GHJ8]|uniref:Leucine-rich repeat-containing serine/threonine-protein kinase n=1 Tax=Luteolibacter rhizosphaerae TaxID=2989719 RepID=A0ABT3G0R1_9BACT|nr:leucine-rich repeat-containing protein kinase family protein [Luteolibacter rhizosphaerae]MCW1912815.1 leucine-rich repeat-containing serine/threonine-protein kinase [Luteolibacter rhizosphaerae]